VRRAFALAFARRPTEAEANSAADSSPSMVGAVGYCLVQYHEFFSSSDQSDAAIPANAITQPHAQHVASRLLATFGTGLGGMALAALVARESTADGVRGEAADPAPHHPPKARRAIQIFLQGGLSQVDSFDYKPQLENCNGKPVPGDQRPQAFMGKVGLLHAPHFAFKQRGQQRAVDFGFVSAGCRAGRRADGDPFDVVRHRQSHARHLRSQQRFSERSVSRRRHLDFVRPGLRSRQLADVRRVARQSIASDRSGDEWSSGSPRAHQGVVLKTSGPAVRNLRPATQLDDATQAARFAAVAQFNRRHLEQHGPDDALASRMRNYELAARMQLAIPQATDLSQETAATLALYGVDQSECADFGRACLLARRLLEHGVRFVQLWSGAAFGAMSTGMPTGACPTTTSAKPARSTARCGLTPRPASTGNAGRHVVIFNTEFGRTPYAESAGDQAGPGRDHNPDAFSVWLAGAGLRHRSGVWCSDRSAGRSPSSPSMYTISTPRSCTCWASTTRG